VGSCRMSLLLKLSIFIMCWYRCSRSAAVMAGRLMVALVLLRSDLKTFLRVS
jgi:hypothetical protein